MDNLRMSKADWLPRLTVADVPSRIKRQIEREAGIISPALSSANNQRIAELSNVWTTVKPVVEKILAEAARAHVIAETTLPPGALSKYLALSKAEQDTLATVTDRPTTAQVKIAMSLTGRDFSEAAKAGREQFLSGLLAKYAKQP